MLHIDSTSRTHVCGYCNGSLHRVRATIQPDRPCFTVTTTCFSCGSKATYTAENGAIHEQHYPPNGTHQQQMDTLRQVADGDDWRELG